MVFEIWKALPEYPFFKVSNAGRVVKLVQGKWVECKYYTTKQGYVAVRIRNSRGEFMTITVHRLVATAFIPKRKCKEKLEVNHLDENKANNRADNLEWVTRSENIAYSVRRNIYSTNKKNRLPIVQLTLNGEYVTTWESAARASQELDIHYHRIRECCHCRLQYKKPVGDSWWIYEDEWKIREKIMSGFTM